MLHRYILLFLLICMITIWTIDCTQDTKRINFPRRFMGTLRAIVNGAVEVEEKSYVDLPRYERDNVFSFSVLADFQSKWVYSFSNSSSVCIKQKANSTLQMIYPSFGFVIPLEKDGKFILTKQCKVGNNVTECNLFAASSCLPGLCTGNWTYVETVDGVPVNLTILCSEGREGIEEMGVEFEEMLIGQRFSFPANTFAPPAHCITVPYQQSISWPCPLD